MNPLSAEERDQFARHLSYSATVGGWFFIFMAAFIFVIFTLPFFGVGNFDGGWDPELIGAFIPLLLAFILPGVWLIRRRSKIRAQLDGDLLTGTADIVAISGPDPYSGYEIKMRVNTPYGDQKESTLNSYAKPNWQPGERIPLLFTADESRFFPQALATNMNMGRLYSPKQTETRQRWIYIIWIIIGGLVLLGFSIGFYEGVTGQ